MTDEQRYLFDLRGYVVVPDAVSADQLRELNALVDQHVAADVAAEETSHRFLEVLEWGQPYLDLIDNAAISPILAAICGERFRLDHVYLDIIRSGDSPIGTTLHGGGTPYSPACAYDFRDGQIRCTLVAVGINLHDVGPDDGGFGCVPGSHKANHRLPEGWKDLSADVGARGPALEKVTGPAGTAIIFSEALTHGPLPWRGSHERRTAFYKYNTHVAAWTAGSPITAIGDQLSERQRAIVQPAAEAKADPWRERYGAAARAGAGAGAGAGAAAGGRATRR